MNNDAVWKNERVGIDYRLEACQPQYNLNIEPQSLRTDKRNQSLLGWPTASYSKKAMFEI